MPKFILLCLSFVIAINLQAQTRTSDNKGLDTLKQNIKALGNLFKKASTVSVTVEGIESNDNNITGLKQTIQQVTGVRKISDNYQQNKAVLIVSYKGRGSELWEAVPQSSKQRFSLITLSDTAIRLNYKNVITTADNSKNINQSPAKTNESISKINPGENKQSTALSKGTALLFKNVKTKLSDETKNTIFDNLGFKLSKDAKQFISDDASAEYPFDALVYTTDLNKDSKEEVFILFGNTFTSGMTGSSIIVFIVDKNGTYKMNMGFPGTLPDVLSTANLGYPDLLIGGPGFEFPVWRWNGKVYNFFKQVKEKELKNLKSMSIEDVSKAYTALMK
ncbi:MAG: hypothetical protein ABJA71_00725 [Ginsengibacter sp.]